MRYLALAMRLMTHVNIGATLALLAWLFSSILAAPEPQAPEASLPNSALHQGESR